MHSQIKIQDNLEKRFNKSMLNRNEIAEYLDVSLGTITNLIKDNQIPYIKLGTASKTSTIRFEISAISQWIYSSKGASNV